MTESPNDTPRPTVGAALANGLCGRCPRCGRGRLFQGLLGVVPWCGACGLTLTGHDAGDATAVPALLIVGGIVVGVLLALEFTYEPAIWVHLVVLVPLAVGLTVLILPPLKGAAIALQYAFRSTEDETRPGGS